MKIVILSDLVDPFDPAGRTYKQINAAKPHTIPIGALVEFEETGVRLFVVHHARDCDQTPLYYLCHDKGDTVAHEPGRRNRTWIGGYNPEHTRMRIIRL